MTQKKKKKSKYPSDAIKYQNSSHAIENHKNQSNIPLILKLCNKKKAFKSKCTKVNKHNKIRPHKTKQNLKLKNYRSLIIILRIHVILSKYISKRGPKIEIRSIIVDHQRRLNKS